MLLKVVVSVEGKHNVCNVVTDRENGKEPLQGVVAEAGGTAEAELVDGQALVKDQEEDPACGQDYHTQMQNLGVNDLL